MTTRNVGASAPPATRPASSTRKLRLVLRVLLLVCAAGSAGVLGSTQTLAQNAYITNSALNEVQVIDTATNRITTAIAVGNNPETVGVSSDGSRIYVGNCGDSGSVSIIDGTSNSVIITIPVGPVVLNGGTCAGGIAVSPDNSKVYVASQTDVGTVSIIDAKTDTITATVTIPGGVFALAVTPNGRRLYITSPIDTVSVFDTASNAVIATINTGTTSTGAGSLPSGVAVSPDGSKVYVALYASAAVAVIDTATNTIVATIPITGAVRDALAQRPRGRRHQCDTAGRGHGLRKSPSGGERVE